MKGSEKKSWSKYTAIKCPKRKFIKVTLHQKFGIQPPHEKWEMETRPNTRAPHENYCHCGKVVCLIHKEENENTITRTTPVCNHD